MGKFIVWTAALANQVVAVLVRWRQARAKRRQRLRAMAELGALSDLELKDIGVYRSEIHWVVNHGRHAPPANMLGKGCPDLLPNCNASAVEPIGGRNADHASAWSRRSQNALRHNRSKSMRMISPTCPACRANRRLQP